MPPSKKKASPRAHTNPVVRAVPQRRSFILLESALLLGLAEGVMWNMITTLQLDSYYKALLLMIGVVGIFALAVRVLEPVIEFILEFIASLDRGGGVLVRIGLHLIVLFLIFVGYVRVFFKTA
jgi:hypothetical protein